MMIPADHYPLVYLPSALRTAQQALPTAPQAPQQVPLLDLSPFTRSDTWEMGLLLVVMLPGGFELVAQHAELFAGLLQIVGLLCLLRAKRKSWQRYAQDVERYHADFHQHVAHLEQLAVYHHALANYSHPQAVARYQAQQVASWLAGVRLPLYATPEQERLPASGRSERHFLWHLHQHFGPATIFYQHCVPVDDPQLHANWFYPDFAYRDGSGLCIDIEIDEPYAWRSKEPIH